MNNTNNKSAAVAQRIGQEIERGEYGPSGSRFLSVRQLAETYNVSLVTAQRVMALLREEGLLTLYGNAHYLSSGRMTPDSPLQKQLESNVRTNLIGIHTPEINNPFFSSLLNEVTKFVYKAGYTPLLMTSRRDPEREKAILHTFLTMGVKGVISCPNSGDYLQQFYKQYPLPLVFLANRFSSENQGFGMVDEEASAKHVADHMIEMAYENFMYVGLENARGSDARRTAFVDALREKGKTVPDENILCITDKDEFSIPYSVSRLIRGAKKPLGIFCFHDMIAVQVIILCEQLGLNIPEEIGVVGFDNLPIAKQCRPTLTTIAYRFDKMADSAVDLLLRKMKSPTEEQYKPKDFINHSLKIRESTRKKGT